MEHRKWKVGIKVDCDKLHMSDWSWEVTVIAKTAHEATTEAVRQLADHRKWNMCQAWDQVRFVKCIRRRRK